MSKAWEREGGSTPLYNLYYIYPLPSLPLPPLPCSEMAILKMPQNATDIEISPARLQVIAALISGSSITDAVKAAECDRVGLRS